MKVTPRTEEELEMDGLLPEGIYPFSVIAAENKVSQKGNDMIKLTLKIFSDTGREGTVWHYLMDNMPQHLAQFCRFSGIGDKYESGDVDASDCEGREGYAKIKIEKGKDGFGPKNVVHYFCQKPEPKAAAAAAVKPQKEEEDPDSEIPF